MKKKWEESGKSGYGGQIMRGSVNDMDRNNDDIAEVVSIDTQRRDGSNSLARHQIPRGLAFSNPFFFIYCKESDDVFIH